MQREAMTWFLSWTAMLAVGLLVTLALVGCEAAGDGTPSTPSLATSEPTPIPAPVESVLADETRAMAERLAASITRTGDETLKGGIDAGFDPFADAMPLPTTPPPGNNSGAAAADSTFGAGAGAGGGVDRELALLNQQADPGMPGVEGVVDVPGGALDGLPDPRGTVVPMPEMGKPMSREDLLAELSAQVRASDDPALVRAVTAAALSLARPGHQLDPAVLEPLKPMQRDAVERLHTLFLEIQKRAAAQAETSATSRVQAGGAITMAGGGFDRKMLDAALADAFGQMPVTIVHADLCRSVSGFGVYEPLASHNFLSGRANRAIVYVEVENFEAAKLDDTRREVRLSQELILYKEDDGLAVWRHEPTQITDVSRNRRRDFYVVQMITLPARLSTGKYRLKVRITDQHGDSVDEMTMQVQVVADAQLLGDEALP